MRFAPALDDGRPHDHLPADRQGDREEGRLPRDVHAEADLRRERLGHAHAHVALQRTAGTRSSTATTSGTCPTSARRFIAGQLRHAREISAVFAQWVNSYKRLVPGLRGAGLRRVVAAEPLGADPDPAVQAGLRAGDARRDPLPRSRLQPVPDVRGAAPRGPRGDRAGLRAARPDGDEPLPPDRRSSGASAGSSRCRRRSARRSTSSSQSELARKALGPHIFDRYVELKRKEWDEYRVQLTAVGDRASYLPVL